MILLRLFTVVDRVERGKTELIGDIYSELIVHSIPQSFIDSERN